MPGPIDAAAIHSPPPAQIAQPALPPSKPAGAGGKPVSGADAKLHKVAKDFEAVFMTEMLRLARPDEDAAPGFGSGEAGKTWRVFMDEALGKAATARGDGTGLGAQIEASLRRAQGLPAKPGGQHAGTAAIAPAGTQAALKLAAPGRKLADPR